MDLKQFGEQLQTFRRQAGLSQERLVDALDQLAQSGSPEDYRAINSSLVSSWEHARSYKGRQWKPTRPYVLYLIQLFASQLNVDSARQWAAQAGYQISAAELQGVFPQAPSAPVLDKATRWQGDKVNVPQEHPVTLSPPHLVTPSPRRDWSEAPDLGSFYGRMAELAILEQCIVIDHCRLVAIVGMGGVGKTALAARLTERIAGQFDRVLWRSLLNAPPLADVLNACLQSLSRQQLTVLPASMDEQFDLLLSDLHRQRCLLVFDNFESILQMSDRAGTYRPGYADYGQLLQRVGQSRHQSCLLVTSRERPLELTRMESTPPGAVRSLHLAGLAEEAGHALLGERGLTGRAGQATLVERYSGNPLALKLVAETINDLYAGDISAFLAEETVVFDDIRDVLDQQFARLSDLEQTLLFWLATEREPVSVQHLQENLVPPEQPRAVLEAVRSLQRRSLLETQGDGFTLQNVVVEYLTARLVKEVSQEIEEGQGARGKGQGNNMSAVPFSLVAHSQSHPVTQSPSHLVTLSFLNRYALIKAQAKEYVRQSQTRLILRPIAERLAGVAGARLGRTEAEKRLQPLLMTLQQLAPLAPGYAAGNILNLLTYLQSDLRGHDVSHLCVWQAYLPGISLANTNFAGSDLTGSVFVDHFRTVNAVAFHPNGQIIAAGTGDGTIRLWRVADGQLVSIVTAPLAHIWSIAFSPDGQRLASGGEDHTVRIWDVAVLLHTGVQRGQVLHLLQGHSALVESVIFSPDSALLASASGDATICIWNAHTGELLRTLAGHGDRVRAVAFSPDGTRLASGSWEQTIRLWDVQTGATLQTLAGHQDRIAALAFSPDGALLASSSWDQTVRLWDMHAAGRDDPLHILRGHGRGVLSIAFRPDGAVLASSSEDQTVRLWDVSTSLNTGVPSGQPIAILHGHAHMVKSVSFSPTGEILASGSEDQTVRLWDAATGQPLHILRGHTSWIQAIHFTQDARVLVSGDDEQRVSVWSAQMHGQAGEQTLRSAQTLHKLPGHRGPISALAFSLDGHLLATGSWDQTVRLWQTASGQCLYTLYGHSHYILSLAFSPDGAFLASGSEDQTVRVWETGTGQLLHTFQGHTRAVRAVAFSPDGTLLASGSYDQTVRIWNLGSGQPIHILHGHTYPVACVAFSPDGTLLASGSWDWSVRLWDVQSGQALHTLTGHDKSIFALAFCPRPADSHAGSPLILASSSYDRTVRLWDAHSGQLLHTLVGHNSWVRCLAFSPDGTLLASGSDDETVRLWEVQTGRCLTTLRAPTPYTGMNITGVTGISEAQRAALKALGAVETT